MALSQGDPVSWNTPQGVTHGTTTPRKTSPFTFDGQKFNAAHDDPYWVAESAKTGAEAVHKESSLTRS
jgi:hypothetical protein